MYSIDGVPLQNPALGWRLKRATEPRVARSFARADFQASNRDGTLSVRGAVSTPSISFVVTSPDANLEALRLLMRAGAQVTLTSNPARVLTVEAMTITPRTVTPAGGVTEVTVVYRIPGVYWRSATTTDWTATLPASSGSGAAQMTVCATSSAPVRDHVIGLVGDALNLRVSGQSGTYLEIAGRWSSGANGTSAQAHLNAAMGRAWVIPNGSDVMSGVATAEITGQVQMGAFPYFLESAPGSLGPGSALTFSWDAIYAPVAVTVRALDAFDL